MDPKVRDELIKEQFICGINNTELQRKLLVLDGEKALQEVVELAESNEAACISARQMLSQSNSASASPSSPAPINAIASRGEQSAIFQRLDALEDGLLKLL